MQCVRLHSGVMTWASVTTDDRLLCLCVNVHCSRLQQTPDTPPTWQHRAHNVTTQQQHRVYNIFRYWNSTTFPGLWRTWCYTSRTNIVNDSLHHGTIFNIRPGNGVGLFLQPRSPHGAEHDWRFITRKSINTTLEGLRNVTTSYTQTQPHLTLTLTLTLNITLTLTLS